MCFRSSSASLSRSSSVCSGPLGCSSGSVLSRVQASRPECREALCRTQQARRMDELLSGEYCSWWRETFYVILLTQEYRGFIKIIPAGSLWCRLNIWIWSEWPWKFCPLSHASRCGPGYTETLQLFLGSPLVSSATSSKDNVHRLSKSRPALPSDWTSERQTCDCSWERASPSSQPSSLSCSCLEMADLCRILVSWRPPGHVSALSKSPRALQTSWQAIEWKPFLFT